MSLLKNIFGKKSDELTENASEINVTEATVSAEKPNAKKNKITKHNQIKQHLQSVGHIDSWTAIEMYGETRLSAVIFNLRMSGYDIKSVPKSALDRNGNLTNFTTYVLDKK